MIRKGFISIFIFTAVCSYAAYAQDSIVAKFNQQLADMKYDSLTRISAARATLLPAEAVYDIGMAWYEKNDDDNSISFMSMTIRKDPQFAKAFYYRGMSYSSIEKYLQGIEDFKEAISLDPTNSEYYSSLGGVYLKVQDYDDALKTLKTAVSQKQPYDQAYSLIVEVYSAQNQMDKALDALYVMKSKVSPTSEYHKVALYNIGLLEFLNGNYDKTEAVAKEYIKLSHNDYSAYPLLLQTYYEKKEYDSAKPLKDTLYHAYTKGRLRKSLKDRFCFDQFKWKDKHVEAFEKFETPRNKGNSKLIFLVFDKEGNINLTIQTEYNPLLVELGTNLKYELGETIGDKDEIFSKQYGSDINYDDLKQSIIDVLDGKLKPKAE